jgi:hypothetical protein
MAKIVKNRAETPTATYLPTTVRTMIISRFQIKSHTMRCPFVLVALSSRNGGYTRFPAEVVELYRAGAVAYRAARRAGELDYEGMCAGRDAVQKIRPDLSDEEAMPLVSRATSYAEAYYPNRS